MIHIKDKDFELYMSQDQIAQVISRLAGEISNDLRDLDPLFCPILNGSFLFVADLVRKLVFDPEICFIKYSSYQGTQSTGSTNQLIGFPGSVKGRNILIVEDIIETGISMRDIIECLKAKEPASIRICTLMHKPQLMQCQLHIDYIGCSIPDAFIVGYGFDYDGHGRSYPDIYSLAH